MLTPQKRKEFGVYLQARREATRPDDVGLDPGPGRRRTPGLRREELAQLAGVGLSWYSWLEQGRDLTASRQVVFALAQALPLNEDERHHLFSLAELTDPEPRSRRLCR